MNLKAVLQGEGGNGGGIWDPILELETQRTAIRVRCEAESRKAGFNKLFAGEGRRTVDGSPDASLWIDSDLELDGHESAESGSCGGWRHWREIGRKSKVFIVNLSRKTCILGKISHLVTNVWRY
jgi:hypothetical protein